MLFRSQDFLLDPNQSLFPENFDIPTSEGKEVEKAPNPGVIIDLFYLLADYYVKNNEFKLAIEFYHMDISWNPQRLDAWVSLSLALCNQIDLKMNEMECGEMSNETLKQIVRLR